MAQGPAGEMEDMEQAGVLCLGGQPVEAWGPAMALGGRRAVALGPAGEMENMEQAGVPCHGGQPIEASGPAMAQGVR